VRGYSDCLGGKQTGQLCDKGVESRNASEDYELDNHLMSIATRQLLVAHRLLSSQPVYNEAKRSPVSIKSGGKARQTNAWLPSTYRSLCVDDVLPSGFSWGRGSSPDLKFNTTPRNDK
jgi:hypothetical protein